jgi:2-polyprenyl-3-methyl-5-hydroxy-6-metoxy-1,4-benzoquinol methylase
MREDAGEQHYREQYMQVISPLLTSRSRVLDVGSQYGRFAVPLAEQGHDVVATDPDPACVADLTRRCPQLDVRHERVDVTIRELGDERFDLVLCLELLYMLPGWRGLLGGLGGLLGTTGRIAASHRSQGYYIYRMLHEGRYDELDELLAGRHPTLNAQRPDELRSAYADAGLRVESVTAIGAFSGIHVDPFAAICDPSSLTRRDRDRLQRVEADPSLADRFLENARYLLVIAAPDGSSGGA